MGTLLFKCPAFPWRHLRRAPPLLRMTSAASPAGPRSSSTSGSAVSVSVSDSPRRKKARRESPEGILRHRLDMCSKNGDAASAIAFYDEACLAGVPLSSHHYNTLLYVCSLPTPASPEEVDRVTIIKRGFEIYDRMKACGVPANEATITAVVRLAVEKGDLDLAFDLVKRMPDSGLAPRLRSFSPTLLGFCRVGNVEKAYAVDECMSQVGVLPEEGELAALLQASAEAEKEGKVYSLLHRLRKTVRAVSESTAEITDRWFRSEAATRVGVEDWDAEEIRAGVVAGGGGWHGKGWLGKGEWSVVRTWVNENGVCQACGQRMVTVDIDPVETENFGKSLAELACQREVKTNFTKFQDWLKNNGPFDAVVDGANVGLFNQGTYGFNFFQLNSVVNALREMSPTKKLPLIVLHSRRLKDNLANRLQNKRLIEEWQRSHALYATPNGSNDDWYWLYAAVNCRSLLVTNDEMRDHLFQLLGNSFFPRWKERHQVRLVVSKNISFRMPPPYSTLIQESEVGGWHIPIAIDEESETPRPWICANRHGLPI
ncbi:Proteinaceous RNase P 1 [Nymphaea thermarum]|nr:Proteinaceous RNase P 1 [Nymphaea thermarum]